MSQSELDPLERALARGFNINDNARKRTQLIQKKIGILPNTIFIHQSIRLRISQTNTTNLETEQRPPEHDLGSSQHEDNALKSVIKNLETTLSSFGGFTRYSLSVTVRSGIIIVGSLEYTGVILKMLLNLLLLCLSMSMRNSTGLIRSTEYTGVLPNLFLVHYGAITRNRQIHGRPAEYITA